MFKRKLTTLSFEGNKIKCLTMQGNRIHAWGSEVVPSEQMNQGVIHDPQAVSKTLSQLLEDTKASRRRVITSVTDQRSIHRIMTLPDIKEDLLEETILRKAKQEFPTPADETDFAWKIVHRSGNQIALYVLAVPKIVIDRQVETLRAANIKPKVMDAKPIALMHAINKETCIILNLESYSMAVILVVNHLPAIVRTVPLENDQLTKEAKLNLLSQELARTIKFYNESHKANPLPDETPVFPTGEHFEFPRLEERLSNRPDLLNRLETSTPYPIETPDPPLPFPAELPIANYAVNIGLAIKGTR